MREKGITLIALIITIIVLLILAGVSIATLIGDNGILTEAEDAKNRTQVADVKEQARLDILAEKIENGGKNLSGKDLKSILDKYFDSVPNADELEEKLKQEDGLKLKSKPQYGGQEIDIGDIYDGDLEEDSVKEPMTADQIDELLKDNTKVQYVTNYGIDIDGDGDARDDWEIFYVEDYKGEDNVIGEENQPTIGKRIFLIASDYVKAETQELQDAVTKEKANMLIDDYKGQYDYTDYVKFWGRNNLPTYHCVFPDDGGVKKACVFPKLFEFSNYDIRSHNSDTNSICAASLLCTDNWSAFVKTSFADFAIGGPSLEMWVHSWSNRHPEEILYVDGNKYSGGYGLSGNGSSWYRDCSLSGVDKLFFPRDFHVMDEDRRWS